MFLVQRGVASRIARSRVPTVVLTIEQSNPLSRGTDLGYCARSPIFYQLSLPSLINANSFAFSQPAAEIESLRKSPRSSTAVR